MPSDIMIRRSYRLLVAVLALWIVGLPSLGVVSAALSSAEMLKQAPTGANASESMTVAGPVSNHDVCHPGGTDAHCDHSIASFVEPEDEPFTAAIPIAEPSVRRVTREPDYTLFRPPKV